MILVDTSVWIDHLRKAVPTLVTALERGAVLIHPFVLSELACGNLKNRDVVLKLLSGLAEAPVATHREALAFIEQRAFMGRGIGYIDVHLLASVLLDGTARLWTHDKHLATLAGGLGLAYMERL
jgi:predicted nucleic acid-binding protein